MPVPYQTAIGGFRGPTNSPGTYAFIRVRSLSNAEYACAHFQEVTISLPTSGRTLAKNRLHVIFADENSPGLTKKRGTPKFMPKPEGEKQPRQQLRPLQLPQPMLPPPVSLRINPAVSPIIEKKKSKWRHLLSPFLSTNCYQFHWLRGERSRPRFELRKERPLSLNTCFESYYAVILILFYPPVWQKKSVQFKKVKSVLI